MLKHNYTHGLGLVNPNHNHDIVQNKQLTKNMLKHNYTHWLGSANPNHNHDIVQNKH